MLEKIAKLEMEENESGRLSRLAGYLANRVNSVVSGTRNCVKRAVPILAVPAGVLLSGSATGCTLDTMGTGAYNENDANYTEDGHSDVSNETPVWPDQVSPDSDGGNLDETDAAEEADAADEGDSMPDAADGDAVSEDVMPEADVTEEDANQESDVQVVDAPGDVNYDVSPGVGAIVWSNNMDGFTVFHLRNGSPVVASSSPNAAVCQQKPFTSLGVQALDEIELFVKEGDPNDGGPCSADGGPGLDCTGIAPALFTPVNIVPTFVEGRCAKYTLDCPAWSGIIPEYNDPAGYTTLTPTQAGGVWKYSVPQNCTSKVYKLHF